MQSKLKWSLGVVLVGLLTLAAGAQQGVTPIDVEPIRVEPIEVQPLGFPATSQEARDPGPTNLIGVIAVPGNPIASTDLLWADQIRGRVYLADRSNKAVDIFDAINNVYVGRVEGFIGPAGPGVTNGAGPNGLLVTPENFLWVGDGNSLLQVADLNLSPPRIISTISVGGPTDGRADELAYDPLERVVLVGNDASKPPKVTFVSADSYKVLGQIQFPDATGLEQPVWNARLHRFLITVPGSPAYVAVVDPTRMRLTKKYIIPNCNAGVNGLTLGPAQRMLVSACGRAYIMNAIDGHVINLITQVAGGDEVWYNAGDGRYYVTAADSTGTTVLGVIDGETSAWVQNVPAPGIRNVTVFEGNNHIFTAVRAPAAGVRDTTVCASFGLVGTGCIAVFSHF